MTKGFSARRGSLTETFGKVANSNVN